MKYHFFSTLCDKADLFLDQTLVDLSIGEIDIKGAIMNLIKVESYDENDKAFFQDADLTKETIYEFVEHICKITNTAEDCVWEIYGEIKY